MTTNFNSKDFETGLSISDRSMIVTGSSPPYKHFPRTLREPNSHSQVTKTVAKLPVSRSDATLSMEKIMAKKRPKSSPLTISEKILENFNMEKTGSRLTFTGFKGQRNIRTMEGTLNNKGLHFKVVQPGYLMTKRKSGIGVTLNMEELCSKESKKVSLPDERETTMKTLQQEIDDLNRILASERISHRSQFEEFIESTKVDVQVMLQEHRDHIKTIEEDHLEEIEKLTEMYETKLTQGKAEAELETARMQEEMDSVRASLETCKEEVSAEMKGQWLKEKKKIESEHELKMEELLAQQRLKLKRRRNMELNNVKQDHAQEIERLAEQHHKEMNTLLEKFAACAADAENLKIALFEAEKLKEEVGELREVCSRTKEQLRKTQNELADAKVKLQGYELSFSEKVAEVEERYSMKIQGLMLNNTDIRRNYMKKCAELLDVQTKTETAQKQSTTDAKSRMKTIILARAKADISLVASNDTDDQQNQGGKNITSRTSRPQSAPTTKRKTSAYDGVFLSPSDHETTYHRPNSSFM